MFGQKSTPSFSGQPVKYSHLLTLLTPFWGFLGVFLGFGGGGGGFSKQDFSV